MIINGTYPKCIDFKKNELKTLEMITGFGSLNIFPELAYAIELAYHAYKNKNFTNTDFSFISKFTLDVEKRKRNAVIGGHVLGDYKESSYFLAICGICGEENDLEMIRKFHFDYAKPDTKSEQPVPIFHMQYGGKLATAVQELKITGNKIEPWLSLPRLNFAPMNLALLLDIMLNEFYTIETHNILQDANWRGLIKKNECFLTKPYYASIVNHADSGNYSTNKLIRDFTYGK